MIITAMDSSTDAGRPFMADIETSGMNARPTAESPGMGGTHPAIITMVKQNRMIGSPFLASGGRQWQYVAATAATAFGVRYFLV